jgi:hypothetical protein
MNLAGLDRRIIFLIMAAAVIIPLLLNITPPIDITTDTQEVFNLLDSLGAGAYVMISFDFEASSFPEMRPLAVATLTHAFQKNLKVAGLALFSEGTALGYALLSDLAQKNGKEYGRDYIYLGFRPQYTAAILEMGESIIKAFPQDYLKHSLNEYSEFIGMHNYNDVALVLSIADGSMPIHWADYANARYGQKVAVACAAVMVTAFKPYLKSGQLLGPVAGVKGAAEYEKLLGLKGDARRRLFAQSTTHAVLIILILGANLAAFLRRKI